MEDKRLKKCSTSTFAEADHDVNKDTKPLQKAKRKLENLEAKGNLKKQKVSKEKSENKQIDEDSLEPKVMQKKTSEAKEMRKLRKSFKEMTEAVKKLQESLLIKANLPVISYVEKEPPKKEEKLGELECCFESEESKTRNDYNTIFVKGFDASLPRDDIKSALEQHFSSCGVVTRVFVPIECKTGASVGFAFIDLQTDSEKALTLRDSLLGGRKLQVFMARHTSEYRNWPNTFDGCKRCSFLLMERRLRRFYVGPDTYKIPSSGFKMIPLPLPTNQS